MPTITYNSLREKLIQSGVSLPITDGGVPAGTAIAGTFTGQVGIQVPQLPKIQIPMEDLTFQSSVVGKTVDLNTLLGIKPGQGGKVNNYAGSQLLLNSDRIILNSRLDYLMLFGQQGVAISSQGNVNIDADDAVTIFGEDGLFLGIPGKGNAGEPGKGGNQKQPVNKAQATKDSDYEPLVLGIKLANLLDDLLFMLRSATIVTPVGIAYFREDTQGEFLDLQARIPEMLSTYGYIDGISHEAVLPEPPRITSVTVPPTTLVGTVTGTFEGNTMPVTPNVPVNAVTNPLADQPDFFETVSLYEDPL